MAPQVPGMDNNPPQLSENVPGVQFPFRQEFARQGAALEHLGEGIQSAAQKGAGIYDEIQRQHDISTSANAATQATVRHSQMVQDIAMSSPDGFVRDPDTTEIIKNSDGSQKTIAQQYWENADHDYQNDQEGMSPRAAAMYRERMQRTIGENTQRLQMKGLDLQAQSTELKIGDMKDTISKDFSRSFVPDTNPYYSGPKDENGAIKQYPSAQKFFDGVQQVLLTRQQMGSVQGKPGTYGPTEVEALKKGDASQLADQWLDSAKYDLMESAGSRAALHKSLKDGSSTAGMQIHSLLDIIDGKDPESQQRAAQKLPTINSSLTPPQIDRWKKDLLGMMPVAKEVDKSEYELQKASLTDAAKGVRDLDQFFGSDLFQKTLIAGGGLQMSAAERTKDFLPIVSQAVVSAATASVGDLSSPESKRQKANAILNDAGPRWIQLAQMLGEKNTQGFDEAIRAHASEQVASKLQEDERQMREDPIKYMAGVRQGPQGPNGDVGYRNKTAHAIENKLDPSSGDPSLFAIFKPLGNKSVLETAQATANNGYARMFGQTSDVSILSNDQWKDQARRIKNSTDPKQITDYFKMLSKSSLTPAQQETFTQNLVHKGELPQTYVDALNLKTPAEREAQWAKLSSGSAPVPDDLSEKQINGWSQEDNKPVAMFLDRKYGPNSPIARKTLDAYNSSYKQDVIQAINRGLSESDARAYARGQRDKTTGAIGIVGAQNDILGFHFGPAGPQVPVEFGSNNYTPDQQTKIRDTLLDYQSKDTLSKYKFVTPPGALPENPNAPSPAEHIAANVSMWRRVGGGWRLQVQQIDKENRATGISQDVQVYGADGKPHYYEVKDSDALAGAPQAKAKSVAPPAVPGLTQMMQKNTGPKL